MAKVVGNYRLIEPIAEGGFGVTYRAEHVLVGELVCIKHANNVSPDDTKIMLEEAKAIWDLRHYAIPTMRDVIEMPDGSLALVMSYVPGPTISQIVEKKKKLDPEHVAWITERVLNGLHYLHFHGVVHGDVKPQNIIVQPKQHMATLVDYGLSSIKPKSSTNTKGYTPVFAAPELEAGNPPLPESDFYGLGMTMIFALGGDVQAKQVPDKTPEPMCEFIKKLIKINPLQRPNWQKIKLMDEIKIVRQKSFGRTYSGMKPLKV